MKLGIDTWFLFALKNKDRAAERLLNGEHTFVIPVVLKVCLPEEI